MKTYFTLSLIIGALSLHAAIPGAADVKAPTMPPKEDPQLAWVDEQIQAILPSRVGIPDGMINSLRDPMKMVIPASSLLPPPKLGTVPLKVEEPLRLQAIINQSVLISGKWYKTGDMIRDYSLTEIKPGSVLLMGKKGHKLILFLTKPNDRIQITTK